jgi:DNA-binding NtrC family response regulator
MKVAIFENEFDEMKSAFLGFNLLYYNKSLEFIPFASSQAFGDIKKLSNFDYVLIDIDLSKNSKLDGFQLMAQMMQDKDITKIKPIILTGQPPVKEKLKARNLPEFPIIFKPLVYTQIQDSFQRAKAIDTYRTN